ncbi:hypothetical protein Dimus_034605 [Dionaea muscipula]
MGRKSNWFNVVKKALGQDSKEKKGLKLGKSKKKWFWKKKRSDRSLSYLEAVLPSSPPPRPLEEGTELCLTSSLRVNLAEAENDQAAAATTATAIEVVQLITAAVAHPTAKSKEELAAIKIQATFRRYLAKRALLALKGLARLKTLMQGQAFTHQTTNTLKAMQTLVRVQSQIRVWRLKMADENLARQKKLLQKHTKELGTSQILEEDWDDRVKSREQIEAHLQNRQEAAARREKAMAYAFSHQQTRRKPASSTNTMTFLDQNNPQWGWSWLERWLAAKPWENANTPQKELKNDLKSSKHAVVGKGSIKTTARKQLQYPGETSGLKQIRVAARLSASTNPSLSPKSVTTKQRKSSSRSPRASTRGVVDDDDVRSVQSVHSDQNRKHSIAGSSTRDDNSLSLASSPVAPSYMAPTASTKAKSRLGSPSKGDQSRTPDRLSVSSAKKRLSYTSSPARSRHSASSITDAECHKSVLR